MPSKEEIKRQKESIELQKQSNQLQRDRIGMDAKSKSDQDDFANALADSVKNIKFQAVEKRELLSISNRLNKVTSEEYALTGKELKSKKFGTDLAKKQLQNRRDILNLERLGNQITGLGEKQQQNLNVLIKGRLTTAKDLTKEYARQQEILEKVQKNPIVKVLSTAGDIAEKLGLGKLTGFLGEASDAAADAITENELNKDGKGQRVEDELGKLQPEDIKILEGDGSDLTNDFVKKLQDEKGFDADKILKGKRGTEGAKAMKEVGGLGKGIGKALKPLSPMINALKALGPALTKALGPVAILMEILSLDSQTSDMAKNTNITYERATQLRSEMSHIANTSGEFGNSLEQNFITGKKLTETFMALNKTLGVSSTKLDKDLLRTMTIMREMAGFTNEEMMGMAKIAITTDQSMEEVSSEFMESARQAGIQNGVMVNTKDLSKSLASTSAATTLSLGKNPKLLGEALATTKALGMEMSQLEGIAGSLLDFESSIVNELSAELLLGKNLNLEKARQAALNNDLATLAQEIAEQAGTAAEFGEMNRIQQEAIASAVGMSREDLAQTLYVQEQLTGATADEAAEQEKLLNDRIAAVGLAKATEEFAKKGFEGLKQQVGMADRLAAVMDKLNELFVGLIEPLMPIIDVFVSIMSLVGLLVKALAPILDTLSVIGHGLAWAFGATNGKANTQAAFDRQAGSLESSWGVGEGADDPTRVQLAKGGIVRKPTRALIGEAGPEAVVPLSKELKVDNSGMERILSEINQGLKRQKPVPLYQITRS